MEKLANQVETNTKELQELKIEIGRMLGLLGARESFSWEEEGNSEGVSASDGQRFSRRERSQEMRARVLPRPPAALILRNKAMVKELNAMIQMRNERSPRSRWIEKITEPDLAAAMARVMPLI